MIEPSEAGKSVITGLRSGGSLCPLSRPTAPPGGRLRSAPARRIALRTPLRRPSRPESARERQRPRESVRAFRVPGSGRRPGSRTPFRAPRNGPRPGSRTRFWAPGNGPRPGSRTRRRRSLPPSPRRCRRLCGRPPAQVKPGGTGKTGVRRLLSWRWLLGAGAAMAAVGAGAAIAMRRRYASATAEAKNATESPRRRRDGAGRRSGQRRCHPLGRERTGHHARHVVTRVQATDA